MDDGYLHNSTALTPWESNARYAKGKKVCGPRNRSSEDR